MKITRKNKNEKNFNKQENTNILRRKGLESTESMEYIDIMEKVSKALDPRIHKKVGKIYTTKTNMLNTIIHYKGCFNNLDRF